jgi:hypothetical protein
MSVRVWRSSVWADWEMECSEHDEHLITGEWMLAMEGAWGHVAMHHPREVKPCAHEYGWHPASRPREHKCLDCGIPLPLEGR